MGRKKLQPPAEQARSYEEFCRTAAREQKLCQTGSWSGWNLLAIFVAIFPGLVGFAFFLALTDPNPAVWQWAGAFGFSGLALWIFSFPMRTAARDSPRNQELQEMFDIWYGWVHRKEVPFYDWEIEGFTGPDGSPSPVWRLWPDGPEAAEDKPLAPEQARTEEQYRCRMAYEEALCWSRPWLGPRGGNFIAWVSAAVGAWFTIGFATAVAGPGPSQADVAGLAGFAAFTLAMISLPVRAFRRDVPRFAELRRMRKRWEAETGYTRPPYPPPAKHPFNAEWV